MGLSNTDLNRVRELLYEALDMDAAEKLSPKELMKALRADVKQDASIKDKAAAIDQWLSEFFKRKTPQSRKLGQYISKSTISKTARHLLNMQDQSLTTKDWLAILSGKKHLTDRFGKEVRLSEKERRILEKNLQPLVRRLGHHASYGKSSDVKSRAKIVGNALDQILRDRESAEKDSKPFMLRHGKGLGSIGAVRSRKDLSTWAKAHPGAAVLGGATVGLVGYHLLKRLLKGKSRGADQMYDYHPSMSMYPPEIGGQYGMSYHMPPNASYGSYSPGMY